MLIASVLFIAGLANAAERIHFLIPAGPGGGLDSTARAIGRALVSERLVERTSLRRWQAQHDRDLFFSFAILCQRMAAVVGIQ